MKCLVKHLHTDRNVSFTGPVHVRLKWAVCGPHCKEFDICALKHPPVSFITFFPMLLNPPVDAGICQDCKHIEKRSHSGALLLVVGQERVQRLVGS